MRILREDACFMVVDYQERLMPVIHNNTEILQRVQILVNGLNLLEVPGIVTEQYPRGLGRTVTDISQFTSHLPVLEKVSFSCYDDQGIKKAIDDMGKKNVIIFGVEMHICVLQTIIDLREAGYNVIVVEDCVSSRKPNDKKWGLKRAIQEGAFVTTTEAILFELTRKAGSDTFKSISKLIQ